MNNNIDSILAGFRLALDGSESEGSSSALFRMSSMLLGRVTDILSSSGRRWSSFLAQMESYSVKSQLPIVSFLADNNNADVACSTVSVDEDMIIRQASISSNVATGLKYIVDECVDNIMEHSKK